MWPTRASQSRRFTILAAGLALCGLTLWNAAGRNEKLIEKTFLIAEPEYGDLARHYDQRFGPLRDQLEPGQRISCCIDDLPGPIRMRKALQADAVRFALLPAIVESTVNSQWIVAVEFNDPAGLQALVDQTGSQFIAGPTVGVGLLERPQPRPGTGREQAK